MSHGHFGRHKCVCVENLKDSDKSPTDNNENPNANNMIDAGDLTQEDLSVLRGDLVGETAHSARWIIGILRSLARVVLCNSHSF